MLKMLPTKRVALLLGAVFLTACSESSPTLPSPVTTTAVSARNAGADGSVAIKGKCETTFTNVAPPPLTSCQAFEPAPSAFIEIAGVCQISHLGRSTMQATQQLLFALDAQGNPVIVNGQPVIEELRNCGVFTAANGDELRHTTEAPVAPGSSPGTVTFEGPLAFTSGTGRFASSSGSALLVGSASVLSATGEFTFEGTLSR